MPARKKAKAASSKEPTPTKKKSEVAAKTPAKRKPLKRLGKPAEEEHPAKSAPPATKKVVKVEVEHCKSWQVFGRRARESIAMLSDTADLCAEDLETVINEEKPRRGAFEITVHFDDNTQAKVWSGIEKGPPRKLKFPDADELITSVRNSM